MSGSWATNVLGDVVSTPGGQPVQDGSVTTYLLKYRFAPGCGKVPGVRGRAGST